MKKILSLLLVLVLVLGLCACGKSEAAQAVDDMIAAIGTVTLESEVKIAAAESAWAALTDEQKEELENYALLTAARASLDTLIAEKEAAEEAARIEQVKQKAAEVDALIDAIGTVTKESSDAITAARNTYDAADEELQSFVTKLDVLEAAETELNTLFAQDVIGLIDAIGTVTLDSGEAITTAQAAYDALSAGAKEHVSNASVLADAAAQLKDLKIADAKTKLARLTVEEDKVRGIAFYYAKGFPYYNSYGYWGADVRCFCLPYMGIQGDSVWLRMVCDYTSGDWVFFEKITFAVDDERYYKTFNYFDVTRDNAYGKIWEYVDIDVGSEEIELLYAIANSESTIIRFEGDDWYDDFTVTQNDKNAIKEMLEIYEALK